MKDDPVHGLALADVRQDPFTPDTAIHGVINRARILDYQLAGHDGRVALAALSINIKNCPFSLFPLSKRKYTCLVGV